MKAFEVSREMLWVLLITALIMLAVSEVRHRRFTVKVEEGLDEINALIKQLP